MPDFLTKATADPEASQVEDLRPFDSPPEGSGYRPSDGAESCGGCLHFKDGECLLYRAKAEASYVCDDWLDDSAVPDEDPDEDFDLPEGLDGTETSPWIKSGRFSEEDFTTPVEIHCSESRTARGKDVVWKELLRTGTWKMTPGPGAQPIDKPLTVKKRADNPYTEVGLEDLKEAFDRGAMDHVTIPLSHANKVDENTGFVRKLKVVPDNKRPGEYSLWAAYDFTDDDVGEKAKKGSIANTSAGILFRYVKKKTGEVFPQVLEHASLTNKPWIDGLTPFGTEVPAEVTHFSLSEEAVTEDIDIDAILLGSGRSLAKTPEKDNWVDYVGGLPRYVREVARSLHKKRGMTLSRAIATAISRIKVWAVKSTNPKTKAKAAKAIAEWEAKKARSKLRSARKKGRKGPNLSEEVSDLDFIRLGLSEMLIEEKKVEFQKPVRRMSLAEARRHRRETLSRMEAQHMPDQTASETTATESREEMNFDEVVADRERIAAENEQLRRKVREGEVDQKITKLSETWGDYPGLLKEVKDVLLADDGGPVLQLSEEAEGEEPRTITLSASDIVERLLDKVPAPTSSKKLSEQISARDDHHRPDDEEQPDVRQRALAMAEALGDEDYKKTTES